jgi:aminoglycoside phosphotransferase (APT) family kinase protein
MSATTLLTPVFAGVGPDHPFAAQVDQLRAAVEHRLPAAAGSRQLRSAELKGRRTSTGFDLVRAYCSLQSWHPSPHEPFAASTLHWTAEAPDDPTWAELTDEPYLGDVEALLRNPAGSVEVLRYVPTRRFTVSAGGVVTKVKRRSRLLDSAGRVAAIVSAVSAATTTEVRVPALVGVDAEKGTYAQLLVEGHPMSELAGAATGGSVLDLLAEAGRVHAAFHALSVPGLPVGEATATVAAVRRDADWAAFFRPELADVLATTRDRLVATAPPASAGAAGTCHGDLVPSHLLAAAGGWTVIDLDLAHDGDRYRDLALFLAGLPGDVAALADGTAAPGLLGAAESAYLTAYARSWGRPLDPRRLAWHRAAAELRHLSLMFSKDTLRPAAVARILVVLEETLPVLAHRARTAS